MFYKSTNANKINLRHGEEFNVNRYVDNYIIRGVVMCVIYSSLVNWKKAGLDGAP